MILYIVTFLSAYMLIVCHSLFVNNRKFVAYNWL